MLLVHSEKRAVEPERRSAEKRNAPLEKGGVGSPQFLAPPLAVDVKQGMAASLGGEN